MKRISCEFVVPITVLAALSFVFNTHGTDANYQLYSVGTRAAGMGGAVCASATDLDACYYNPAGLGSTRRDSVSLSASLYGIQRIEIDDAIFSGEDWSASTFMTIPSTIGIVRKLGDNAAFGFGAFVPEQRTTRQIKSWSDSGHYLQYSDDAQTLTLGPSLGYQYTPKLSVGASLLGAYESRSRFQSLLSQYEDQSASQSIKFWTFNLLAQVGLQYELCSELRLGVRLQSPPLNLGGSGQLVYTSTGQIANEYAYMDEMDVDNALPAAMTAGLAWKPIEPCRIGLDVTYHCPRTYTFLDGTDQISGQDFSQERTRESVTDVNLGCEYYLRKEYPLRAGFFTSYSSASETTGQNGDQPGHIDLYGVTCSAGREVDNLATSLGVMYIFGSGKEHGYYEPNTDSCAVVDATEQDLYLFVTTAYMF